MFNISKLIINTNFLVLMINKFLSRKNFAACFMPFSSKHKIETK